MFITLTAELAVPNSRDEIGDRERDLLSPPRDSRKVGPRKDESVQAENICNFVKRGQGIPQSGASAINVFSPLSHNSLPYNYWPCTTVSPRIPVVGIRVNLAYE